MSGGRATGGRRTGTGFWLYDAGLSGGGREWYVGEFAVDCVEAAGPRDEAEKMWVHLLLPQEHTQLTRPPPANSHEFTTGVRVGSAVQEEMCYRFVGKSAARADG